MQTFCLDDLNECDMVPCAGCHKLCHETSLNEQMHCEHCESASAENDFSS